LLAFSMKNTSFQFLLSLAVLADWKYLFSSLHKILGGLRICLKYLLYYLILSQ